jgi:hypothetical protein
LSLKEIQIGINHFPINTIDLQNSKVSIRPEQADSTQFKNVIIGDKRKITIDEKILSLEVVLEKTPDGKGSPKV